MHESANAENWIPAGPSLRHFAFEVDGEGGETGSRVSDSGLATGLQFVPRRSPAQPTCPLPINAWLACQ